MHQATSEKRPTINGNNLLPSKFFQFTADPVLEGKIKFNRKTSPESVSIPLNSFGAKFQTTFVVCFFYFKLSFRKTFISKVERLNVKQHRSRRLNEPSHLDLCCLKKPIIIACVSERVKRDCMDDRNRY